MKLQRKIVLGALAASVVISVILTVVFANQPKVVETVQASSSEIKEQEFLDASYTEEDFMEGDDSFASENQAGNSSKNNASTPTLSGSKVTALNKPKGWSASSDKSKNSTDYKWPSISPNDIEAGIPITEKRGGSDSELISEFVFMQNLNGTLPFSVECNISGNRITALLPAGTHIDVLRPEFTTNADKVLYKNTEVKSGKTAFNFTVPIELTVVKGGRKAKYTVYVMTLNTGLPSVSISTADFDDITSKTEYKKCTVFAGGGDTSYGDYAFAKNKYITASATIKGRGWTSWYYYPKKSYTLKLEKKQEMLGLPAHTEWVLSANYADRSLIRNAVAMELAHNLNSEAVMDVRFVDLWVNGTYAGNYQLIEKVEVSKNRVDITKFKENLAPDKVGYIIETNGHNKAEGEFGVWTNGQDADRPLKWQKLNDAITLDPISGDMFFNSLHYDGIIFNINKPSDTKLLALSKNRQLKYLEYIYDYMDKTEAAIKSGNYADASKYLDMEAMAKWYIVEELAMNTDSQLHCSCYMYKDAGGKLKMGPVWDFDLGFGNGKYANEKHKNNSYLDHQRWFADLTQMPEFRSAVKSVWSKSKTKVSRLPTFVDRTARMINKSQKINFEIWSITDHAEHTYYRTTEEIYEFSGQISYLRSFVTDRITYMDKKIMGW
ncbi:MAG: CotH kinase family protein [Clostridia bacterium]|nr:CotH kinase family protein [Clostridia bacterium]